MAGGAPAAPVMVEQGTGRVLEFPVERPAITPVPESVPVHPVGDIAEQAAEVAEPKPRRRNSAQPVLQTGIKPRTLSEVAATPSPRKEITKPDPTEAEVEVIELVTAPQLKKLSILLREAGFDTTESKHGFTSTAIERNITSAKELTKDEASKVIDILESGRNSANDRGAES